MLLYPILHFVAFLLTICRDTRRANMAIMEFVQRFQALQLQRDSSDELIKVGQPVQRKLQLVTSLGFIALL